MELLELVAEDEKRLALRSGRSHRRRKKGAAAMQSPTAAPALAPIRAKAAAEAAAPADAEATATPTKAGEPLPAASATGVSAPQQRKSAADAAPTSQQMPVGEARGTSAADGRSTPSSYGSDATECTPWEQQRGGEQEQGQWEVQQRSRKSGPRRPSQPPRQPPQAGVGDAVAGAEKPESPPAERLSPAPQQPLPPSPQPQEPCSGDKRSLWADVVAGASNGQAPVQEVSAAGHPPAPAAWPTPAASRLQHAAPAFEASAARAAAPLAPRPVRLRAEPLPALQAQQTPQEASPASRQPLPGFSHAPQPPGQHPLQQPHTPRHGIGAGGASRRSSAEYSLWGEDSGMALSLSASRDSLTSVSDMSFGSPPLAGLGAAGMHSGAGFHSGGLNPGGLSIGGMPPIGPGPKQQQPGGAAFAPAAAPASLFQNFGPPQGVGGAQQPSSALDCGGAMAAGFSLFCNFPAAGYFPAAGQQAGGSSGLSSGSPWSGAMPAGFSSLFGSTGIAGRTMVPTMLV